MTSPLHAFIAEDEPTARERLTLALARVAPHVRVVGHADSVRGTQARLATHAAPDLLLLDIQLSDGLSLDLFADGHLALPTIFTTAYDRFAIAAFRALAVDYLLKPVADAALAQALHKAERLRQAFAGEVATQLMQQFTQADTTAPRWRQRLVGRKGSQFHALGVDQIACLVALDKLVFAVDTAGERYLLDSPLAELETALDPARFFRVNHLPPRLECAPSSGLEPSTGPTVAGVRIRLAAGRGVKLVFSA